MTFNVGTTFEAGDVRVIATSGRGLNPEELTDMILPKILYIGPDAPPDLRLQAKASEARLRVLLTEAFRVAQRSQNTTTFNELMNAGHPDAAEIVRSL